MFWTAGGIVSTAYDLARWIEVLYGGRVLKPDSLTEMTKWSALSGSNYGLGTLRVASSKGEFWGHDGGLPGFRSYAGYCPTCRFTVVVLVNQDDADAASVWSALVKAL
jgi:D-alanyl-D-alanine carboxypeptidase